MIILNVIATIEYLYAIAICLIGVDIISKCLLSYSKGE